MATRRQREEREVRYADTRERLKDHEQGGGPESLSLPKGVELFRFKETGVYVVDIVPYVVQRNKFEVGGNPYVKGDPGSLYWERTYGEHQNVGGNRGRYCCLARNWKKACPICEYVQKLGQDPNNKAVRKRIGEKERQIFYFYDHADKEIKVYECSHFMGFGELLEKKLAAADKRNRKESLNFFHLGSDGMSLEISVEEAEYSIDGRSGTYNKASNIEFVPREDPDAVSIELVESLTPLDDLLVEIPYKKLLAIFMQSPSQTESNGEAKGQSKPKRKEDEDEDDEDEDTDEEEEGDEGEEDEEGPGEDDDEKDEEAEDAEEDDGEETDEDEDEDEGGDEGGGGEEVEDEEEEEPPKKPAKKPATTTTAPAKGKLKKGLTVKHPKYGVCTVDHVSTDGNTCRLETDEGELKVNCKVSDCKPLKG